MGEENKRPCKLELDEQSVEASYEDPVVSLQLKFANMSPGAFVFCRNYSKCSSITKYKTKDQGSQSDVHLHTPARASTNTQTDFAVDTTGKLPKLSGKYAKTLT
jgi:hypothetical protein